MSKPGLSEAKRALLQKMLSGGAAVAGAKQEGIMPRAPGAAIPLSLEQAQVWLHSSMAPDQPLYNEPITIHRKGSFDLGVMERAFNEILRRHEAWRTSFATVDDKVVQIVNDIQVRLRLVDITHLPAAEREAEAIRLATEDARGPFDLTTAPLFRAQVIKLADDDHRLYLTLHHIIFDGVTIYRMIVPEFAVIYEALARGTRPDLPEPKLQYGDYAIWREKQMASAEMARQMDYWRDNLAGPLPVLQLPTDRPRPARQSFRGSMETFTLPREVTETLQAYARSQGATLYMALLAGFEAMLHRYTGQEDILVGGVTDTRRRPELEGVVGYFLNSLVLRTRPKADQPFRELLAQTRNAVLGALGASDVPFDRLVRELAPKRDLSAHPLFQVFFSIEPPVPAFAEGFDLTQMDVTMGTAKFDIYLELDERPEGYIGRFMYATDLFDAPTIRRMIGHWQTLLAGAAADPKCPLSRLPLLTANEQQQILVDWNTTQQPLPAATLHGLFEAQAKRIDNSTALEFGSEAWTYRQLDRRACKLAVRLRQAGVEQGTLVAICVERSLDMMAGLLAILKCGAAYLPLDPAFPAQRTAMILDDAKPAVTLTQRALASSLPAHDAWIVICDQAIQETAAATDFGSGADPEDIAYVLYTSGSTGKPKGVEVSHRAVVNLLLSMQREPGFTANDAMLAVTTLSFDIAMLELFLPLVCGGKVVIAPRDIAADVTLLAELIAQSRCTVMQATPATWRALIEEGWPGQPDLKILCGGEAMTRDLANKLTDRCASLWNMYGPTETTIWSTIQRIAKGEGIVPIGRPIGNTTTFIVDKAGNPVPVGVPGELLIGGAGVACGYRGRADLTAERFVTRAFARGEKLYRTGDLARYGADGVIECLGRTDNQVKVRGFRIELEEIESRLLRHPDIAAAAVKAWPDNSGENSLAAYVVMRDRPMPAVGELRQYLKESLPDYMVPQRFMPLDALPMTPNGKVDRKALPEVKIASSHIAPQNIAPAPRDSAERKLAAIWADLLGVETVGSQDDFFDLGGHSLLVAKMMRRIEAEFGRRLPMAAVFNTPTLEGLAGLLGDRVAVADLSRVIAVQPKGSRVPLFWLNGGTIFHPLAEALGPDQPFYDVPLELPEDATEENPPSLSDVAAEMVSAICQAQPHGPYNVGGWCTSGILAFEVMSQLRASGAEVGVLVLAHAANPLHFKKLSNFEIELSKLRLYAREFLRQRPRQMGKFALDRALGIIRRINEPWLPEEQRQPGENKVLEQSAWRYAPKPFDVDAILFQPEARPDVFDHWPGWVDVIRGKFTAADIPGSHLTMLAEPNVQTFADILSTYLNRIGRPPEFGRKAAG